MNSLRGPGVLALVALLAAGVSGCPGATTAVAVGTPGRATAANSDDARALPSDVDTYSSTDIGAGLRCEVGARLTGDLLQERPVVYLVKPDGTFAWHARLPIPAHFYQGRATHCVASGDRLFVLVQADTDSRQSLNQTMLRMVELDKVTGKLVKTRNVDVPHISASFYTSWVDKGAGHFMLEGNHLVVRGEYELLSDRDSGSGKPPTAFVVELPIHPRH